MSGFIFIGLYTPGNLWNSRSHSRLLSTVYRVLLVDPWVNGNTTYEEANGLGAVWKCSIFHGGRNSRRTGLPLRFGKPWKTNQGFIWTFRHFQRKWHHDRLFYLVQLLSFLSLLCWLLFYLKLASGKLRSFSQKKPSFLGSGGSCPLLSRWLPFLSLPCRLLL